ncbi:unnamed protein product [Adineta steineri]|uniref:Arrestin C-terminal-like domain-containing protein n=1 Tax=Adineta steineri TaxID=433720 RepID=A0A814F0A3_9BILA|nr:unnamed protein product [Adineta steineri]CAF4038667.1 unnamed protein product [Adineta steineri]
MGSGFSELAENISLKFDKTGQFIYQTDEIVSGTVKFFNDGKSELKLKSIFIELVGEIVYYRTRDSGTSRRASMHVETFFTERQMIRTVEKGDSFILESGNYTWPFSLSLVDSLPTTLEQTRHEGPYLRYVVRIQLIQFEWHKKNIQKACFITVQSVSSPIPMIESKDDNKNEKSVHLHAILQSNIVVVGKKLILRVDLHNQNRALINRISLTLIQQRLLGSAVKEELTLLKQNLNGIHDFQDENLHDKFEFRLPEKIAPSCSYIPEWSNRKPITVRYEVHLEAHVHGLCRNIHLRLPLTIVNGKQQINNEILPPPSYEKISP